MQFEMQFNWDIFMRVFYKRAIGLNIVGECVMHDTTPAQHVAINMCAPTLWDETLIAIDCYEPGGHT